MTLPLRLVVFDATQLAKKPVGLGLSWRAGAVLYRSLGWVDHAYAARDWASALAWLTNISPERPIREIQYWGHGKWGRAFIDRDVLDRRSVHTGHRLRPELEAVRARMTEDGLFWFRTCETLGARAGQDFARAFADFMGVRVAGHTYEIAYFQSGLQTLAPGTLPHWDPTQGLTQGTAESPVRAKRSHPNEPNTITCLTSDIPAEFRR